MNAIDRSRWNDDRIDDLSQQVRAVAPLVADVAVLKVELGSLSRELRANTKATQEVAQQLEKTQTEPLTRARNFRSQIAIALVAAVVSGAFVIVGVLISHG
jgi:hypothetical protein